MRPSFFFKGAATALILSATLGAVPAMALAAEPDVSASPSVEQTPAASSDSTQQTAADDQVADDQAADAKTPVATPAEGSAAPAGEKDESTEPTSSAGESATSELYVAPASGQGSEADASTGPSAPQNPEEAQAASIDATAHVQDGGWLPEASQGDVVGTVGRGKRLEAVRLTVKVPEGATYKDSDIRYRAHVQNVGWQRWVNGGEVAGTTGKSLRIEALQVELRDGTDLARDYELWYRGHVQNVGWMAWTNKGPVGSTGRSLRLEAIEVMLVRRGEEHPSADGQAFLDGTYVSVAGHVQNLGWMKSTTANGQTVGTTGRGLRLEALRAHVCNAWMDGDVKIQVHVQDEGWHAWSASGDTAGTVGKGRRIEALSMELTDDLQKSYDVWYRVHVQTLGWMAWAKNGEVAGTTGLSARMEGVQVVLTPKVAPSPSAQGQTFSLAKLDVQQIEYSASQPDGGWLPAVQDGSLAGSTGQSKALQAFLVRRSGDTSELQGNVQYRAFVQNKRWLDWQEAGGQAGTVGEGLRLEAVQMRLSGELAKYFDVYYQSHVSGYGWLDWARDGQTSGSAGYSRAIEALRAKLVLKGTDAPGKTLRPAVVKTSVRRDGGAWRVYGEDGSVSNLGTIAMNTRYINQVSEGAIEGCEAASLLMALWSKGYLTNVSYRTFLSWMPYASDGNPNHGFVGSPWTNSPAIDCMMMPAVANWGSRYAHTKNLTGCSDEALIGELVQGHPVVVWTSVAFKPSHRVHYWWGDCKSANHVMTLLGFNPHTNQFYVADPYMDGKLWVSWDKFMQTWRVLRGAVSVW